MNIFQKTYLTLLFEEVLNDKSLIDRIANLDAPVSLYFEKMRENMAKAVKGDEENHRQVNEQVNIWNDKLKLWLLANWNDLDAEKQHEMNDIMMKMLDRYTYLMDGVNTGY